ncbi:MAG: hypothetical protein M3126_00980 [Candidatus Eremiobacteraeota bacterium]|nr:hypothetical protein [Candidatus Eremiobacteraeota bacterium]
MKRLFIVLGLALMTGSAAASVGSLVVAGIFSRPALPSPCATAAPSSAPHSGPTLSAPAPTPACFSTPGPAHGALLGEGPLQLSAIGGLALGLHRSKSAAFATNQNQVAVSMLLSMSRRTAQTSLTIEDAVGTLNNATTVGQLVLGYSTPKYSVSYGPVVGPSETQLAIGGAFSRGVTLTLPRLNGELDLIAASSTSASGEGFRSLGLRRIVRLRGGSQLSSAIIDSFGNQGGRNTVFDLSLVRYRAGASYRAEAAYGTSRGIPGQPDGGHIAGAFHADFANPRSFTSLNLLVVPEGFTTLGSAQFRQRMAELSYRRELGRFGGVNLDLQDNRSGTAAQPVHATQSNLTWNVPFSFGSLLALAGFNRNDTAGSVTVTQTRGFALSEAVKRFALTQTVQSATATSRAGRAMQSVAGFTVGHSVGRGYLFGGETFGRSQSLGALTTQNQLQLGFTMPVGRKATFGISSESQSTTTSGTLIRQQTLTFDVQRRISNLFTVHVSGGRAMQQGIGGGSGSFFNIDLTGPLGIGGNARYSGRPNPNLPAIVRGHVYFQDSPIDFALAGQRGIPNALVILDSGVSERTDASGSFEFHFVPPGRHTLAIEPGTLPSGLIPDEGAHVFDIHGGQIGTFDFSAGAFAGLSGHLTSGGAGLSNVTIAVDGLARTVTDSSGRYQIGRLLPGTHTVAVVTESLPADVQLDGAPARQITIAQGALSQMDFVAKGLGAIKGTVLVSAGLGASELSGAKDVYVVASPGDHAAITDPDGAFELDNLPLGTYTLTVDPQTIPDDQSVIESPEGPFIVTGADPVSGLIFKLGRRAKEVVFSFSGSKHADVTAVLSPDHAPPGALVDVAVTTSERDARAVSASSDLLGKVALRRVSEGRYAGTFLVPRLPGGDVPLHVAVGGKSTGSTDALLTVDPKIPLVYTRLSPAHPRPGSLAKVTAKILADVAGQKIVFADGYTVTLPPGRGRLFSFEVRIWSHGLPYPGTISTRHGAVPIVLGGL